MNVGIIHLFAMSKKGKELEIIIHKYKWSPSNQADDINGFTHR